MRYHNKERQKAHEKKMYDNYSNFLLSEKKKVDDALCVQHGGPNCTIIDPKKEELEDITDDFSSDASLLQ